MPLQKDRKRFLRFSPDCTDRRYFTDDARCHGIFVIAPRADGKIGISARSLGELNVQLIMEELGGGGHLTNAACQIEVETVQEVEDMLKSVLENKMERGNS